MTNQISPNSAFSSDASLLSMLKTLREIQLKLGRKPRSIKYSGVMSSGTLLKYVAEELAILADAITSTQVTEEVIKQIVEAIQGKIDSNQGIENAGKFMGVNDQGKVVPRDVPGISPESVKTIEKMTKLLENNQIEHGAASDLWVVTHNLGMYPNVTVVDSTKTPIIGEVTYVSENQLVIRFNTKVSGTVYLN